VISTAFGELLQDLGPSLLDLAGASVIGPYVLLLAVAVAAGGVVATFTGWAIRRKAYPAIVRNRLIQSGSTVGTQIAFGLTGAGALGLFFGTIIGSAAGSTGLARTAWRADAAVLRRVRWHDVRAVASRYRRFPIYSAPSAFINAVGLEAPLLLMTALFGTTVGGFFALSQRILGAPVVLISNAIGQVYFGEAARLAREPSDELRRLFVRTTRNLVLLGALPCLAAIVLAPWVFGTVFGAAWSEAGWYIAILAPWSYVQVVAISTSSTLDVLERQDLHLVRELLRVGLLVGAILLAGSLDLDAIQALVLLSASGCIMYLLYILMSWRAITGRQVVTGPLAGADVADLLVHGSAEGPGE
jgi:O-antigen/teichoic acid export membrane protein